MRVTPEVAADEIFDGIIPNWMHCCKIRQTSGGIVTQLQLVILRPNPYLGDHVIDSGNNLPVHHYNHLRPRAN
jgi:hypothetical protein